MRLLLLVLVLLTLGLLVEGIFDSAVGAWIALGSLVAIAGMKVLGWVGLHSGSSPDFMDGD